MCNKLAIIDQKRQAVLSLQVRVRETLAQKDYEKVKLLLLQLDTAHLNFEREGVYRV